MSEVRDIHYMSKEMLESLKYPEAVCKELDKTGKNLAILDIKGDEDGNPNN